MNLKRHYLFCLITFLALTKSYAQNLDALSINQLDSIGDEFYYSGDYDNCYIYSLKSFEKAEKTKIDSVISKSLNNLGLICETLGKYEEAEKYLLRSVQLRSGLGNPFDYAVSLNNLALLYHHLSEAEKAEKYYKLALENHKLADKGFGSNYAYCLKNLASFYDETGKKAQAETMYLEALSILKNFKDDKNLGYFELLNNLSVFHIGNNDLEKAFGYLEMAYEHISRELGEDNIKAVVVLSNLAGLEKRRGNFEKAEQLYNKSLFHLEKKFGIKSRKFLSALHNLGKLYLESGNTQKADKIFVRLTDILREEYDNPEQTTTLVGIANYFSAKNKPDSSLIYLKKAFISASPSLYQDSNFEFSNFDRFNYYDSKAVHNITYTIINAYILKHKNEKNDQFLLKAYEICKAAVRYNESIKNSFSSNDEKINILKNGAKLFSMGIDLASKIKSQNYIEEAFSFSELNKSILLADATKAKRARNLSNLPDSLALKEQNLERESDRLKKAELNAKTEEEKLKALKKYNTVLVDIENFKNEIEKKYPKYYKLKYEPVKISVDELKKMLKPEMAFIEYFISDTSVYAFYFDQSQTKLISLPIKSAELKKLIGDYRLNLTDYKLISSNPEISYEQFCKLSFSLFSKTINPVAISKNIKHLIIVTDGELGHIPFETFISSNSLKTPNFSKLPYLLKDYKITYSYSAALWKENNLKNKVKSNSKMLGIAASYNNENEKEFLAYRTSDTRNIRAKLTDLPEAKSEVKSLSEIYKGEFWQETASNEASFKKKAKNYGILHLAMHGIQNADNPILSSLAFTETTDSTEDNFLEAWEIAHMDLNAQLVVLSACETGYGKFVQGEGVLSIARSFMYAGVPSLVVSLWQVNDASTAIIMKEFYQKLSEGYDKAEALRLAKLSYLNEVESGKIPNFGSAHPAYWGAFIQLGNSDPIRISQKSILPYILWPLGGLVVLTLGFFLYRRNKKKEIA